MATGLDLLFARESAATQGLYLATATASPVLWIRYLGTTDSGASIEVEAAGDLQFTTDGTTADTTIDSDGDTAGEIDVSETPADTLGEVLDLINASPNWEAYLLAGIRSAASTNTLTTLAETDVSTATYKTNGIFLYGDMAAAPNANYGVITGWSPGTNGNQETDETCVSNLAYIQYQADVSSAGTLKVYSASQTGETLLYSGALVDNTTTTHGSLNSLRMPLFQSKYGERIVVMVDSDQTIQTGDFLQVVGWSYDRSGQRYINGLNLTN